MKYPANRCNLSCITLLWLAGLTTIASAQEVILRRGVAAGMSLDETHLVASSVSLRGVTVTLRPPGSADQSSARTTELGLDQVRFVSGGLAPLFRNVSHISEDLWRARNRLETGDLNGAEPLYDLHFKILAGVEGPTAQALHGGLLLCRLARGAQVLSLEPWLYYVHAAGDQHNTTRIMVRGGSSSEPSDLTAVDPVTLLCPAMPPIWLDSPALRVVPQRVGTLTGRAARFAALYDAARSAELVRDSSLTLGNAPVREDFGEWLCWQIVSSRTGNASQRQQARGLLREITNEQQPPWVHAWCRVAIGRSLTLETDEESKLLGVAELLTVPTVFAFASPYLTGLAYVQASVTLHQLGDHEGSDAIAAAFLKAMPGHPAAEWEPFANRGSKPSIITTPTDISPITLPGGVR